MIDLNAWSIMRRRVSVNLLNLGGVKMKYLALVFVTLFSFTSQARSLAPDSLLHGVELSDGVKVLQITIESQFDVSCPQPLKLRGVSSYSENLVTVSLNENRSDFVKELMSGVSPSCKSEIIDHQLTPGFRCLSFGKPFGTVYVPVSNLTAGDLMIALPVGYALRGVVELK